MLKKVLLVILVLIVAAAVIFFAPGFLAGDIENETRVTVEKPRDHVWDKFEDESKMGEWLENFVSIENIEGPPRTVGSKFKIKFDNEGEIIEMVETMTAYDEKEHFAFTLENESMYSEIDVRLIDQGMTTEIVQKEKYRGQNVLWHSLFYWLKSTIAENSLKNMQNFKKFAEGD